MVKSVSPNNKGFPHFGLSPISNKQFSYISVINEASDFKFGKPLGFTKAHHKIPRRSKVGMSLG